MDAKKFFEKMLDENNTIMEHANVKKTLESQTLKKVTVRLLTSYLKKQQHPSKTNKTCRKLSWKKGITLK